MKGQAKLHYSKVTLSISEDEKDVHYSRVTLLESEVGKHVSPWCPPPLHRVAPTVIVTRRQKRKKRIDQALSLTPSVSNTDPTQAENERLQSDRENNKHHCHKENTGDDIKASTATVPALSNIQAQTQSLCNDNPVTPIGCCHDVNCYLNANACETPHLRDSSGRTTGESCTAHTSESNSSSVPITPSSKEASEDSTPGASKCKTTPSEEVSPTIDFTQNNQHYYHIHPEPDDIQGFGVEINLDIFTWGLFLLGLLTRFYKLSYPPNVVFDELHYGKSVAHYIRHIFFFDQHPPLGKQIIAAVADSIGYDGNFTGTHIGSPYADNVPIFWLRFVPALCGSLLPSAVYTLLKESGVSRWCSLLGGLLIIFDNSLLIQSRLVLMESMLFLFSTLGVYFLLKSQKAKFPGFKWILYAAASAALLAFGICVKYAGFFTYCLAVYLILKYLWDLLYNPFISDFHIVLQSIGQLVIFTIVPLTIYVGVFYVHLQALYKAGPHDAILTSAFQASLEGGLAAITRNQPMKVAHGSQITLRHTYGRRCWLHSHAHIYPVRYSDNRGSSHQQQVTCYPFKDVNNWWIVKKPDYDDVVVGDEPEYIQHGDIIQLVHGITSRALNSHDVAAPVTPQCQEVSCYIDYEINMLGELLWKVDILNKDTEGPFWNTIKSEVRLIHETTGAALKFSGRILPEWGFNQHEVVADRSIDGKDTVWNVEEHRYTKDSDQEERGRKLLMAQMIPTEVIKLSFLEKFLELQQKMLLTGSQVENHMYSSGPLEWPLLTRGIAYWLEPSSNKQIHLLGNVLIWYTATFALIVYLIIFIFYILRRRRVCYDIDEREFQRFLYVGHLYFIGYLWHYLPYFFKDGELFLHHYLPAFLYKAQLLCFVIDHIDYLLRHFCSSSSWVVRSYRLAVLTWFVAVVGVYIEYLPITYGLKKLSMEDIVKLRWKDSWEFVTHRMANKNWPLEI